MENRTPIVDTIRVEDAGEGWGDLRYTLVGNGKELAYVKDHRLISALILMGAVDRPEGWVHPDPKQTP